MLFRELPDHTVFVWRSKTLEKEGPRGWEWPRPAKYPVLFNGTERVDLYTEDPPEDNADSTGAAFWWSNPLDAPLP